MIEEAYCSFEVAKLLNEKGFEAYTHMVYKLPSQLFHMDEERLVRNDNGITKGDCIEIPAPTHQMACAWLRETHKLFIEIHIEQGERVSYKFMIWDFYIIHPNKYVGGTYDLREEQKGFSTPEQAIEAALKYTLENLL